MNVLIVGLGLMGGAYAYRLSNKGYNVYGYDRNASAVEYAMENGFITEGSTDSTRYIKEMDIIILCIYPQAILKYLEEHKCYFSENQIITDICGVKSSFVPQAYEISKPATYLSHHPMAGREKIGIEYSKLCIFEDANFLITPYDEVKQSCIDLIKQLGKDLGFLNISVMSMSKHDRMIGFTSQLTHAIAVSLVNSDHDPDTRNFIGDSYRDLTRIAMINENLWSELFLENRENLLGHIQSFENELDKLKDALNSNDKKALEELFINSTKIRRGMEK